MTKPTLFIGSSSEGLLVAEAISVHLGQVADVELWNEGVFGLSHGTLEELVTALDKFEFAVLVVTPDDTLKIRDEEYQVPRDNVMFEAGLFMGRLGRRRVFLVAPMLEKAYLPSDLAGITVARYNPTGRSLSNATRSACIAIKNAIGDRRTRPVIGCDLSGSYKYRCSAVNNEEFTHGGACLLRWDEEFKKLKIAGRRLWQQSNRDGKVVYQKLRPFLSWISDWGSVDGYDYRYTY